MYDSVLLLWPNHRMSNGSVALIAVNDDDDDDDHANDDDHYSDNNTMINNNNDNSTITTIMTYLKMISLTKLLNTQWVAGD